MIQAIIDVGSNTVRMAIYNIENADGRQAMELLMKKKHLVGLAGFVENGIMKQAGIDEVCKVLEGYSKFLNKLGIDRVEAFTTAALRNCQNSDEAVREIIERTGIPLRVVPGDEEAELGFIGATHNSQAISGLLVDIGGGSTEIVYYENKNIVSEISLPIGSLNFKTRFVKGLFPVAEEIDEMVKETEKLLGEAESFAGISQEEICGIGGTFKGAAAIYNVIYEDKEKVNGGLISSNAVFSFKSEILQEMLDRFTKEKLTEEDSLILLRAIPERLETVLPGIVIASVLAKHFGTKRITYSDSGMREGFIVKNLLSF